MIIPMVCFSCGQPISHQWTHYTELVKKHQFEQHQDLTYHETENTQANTQEKPSPEFLALAELKIGKECCRRMFLSQQDMYEKIR